MNPDEPASDAPIKTLIRLRAQLDAVIAHYENGMPLVDEVRITKGDVGWLIEIGEFTICSRYAGRMVR